MLHYRCPHCGLKIKSPDKDADKVAPCPRCGRRFRTPGLEPAPAVDWSVVTDSEPEPQPAPRPLPASRLFLHEPAQQPMEVFPLAQPAQLATGPEWGVILGTMALIAAGVAGLFLVLPCFWFLAVPAGGLAAMIGLAGMIASNYRQNRGALLSLGGFLGGVLVGGLALLATMGAQMRLNQVHRDLQRNLEDIRQFRD